MDRKRISETPLQRISDANDSPHSINLWIKREDLIHPQLSGNKWHKLRFNLQHAKESGLNGVISFGGAFSNHLHALAWAGQQQGLKTVGVVRGELTEPLNPTLADCKRWGMSLIPVSREEYRRRADQVIINRLRASFPDHLLLPEGGANDFAIQGCQQWALEIQQQLPNIDYLCVASGTGATLAGLIAGLPPKVKVLGFPVLKGDSELASRLENWLAPYSNHARWRIIENYHFGGYAKVTQELVQFIDAWQAKTRIPIEPIYTGKLLYGVMKLLEADYFPADSNVVVVHSGGMQGLRGMQAKLKKLRQQANSRR